MKMPEWPAILKLEGIDELIYIADAQQWRREIKTLRQSGGDLLIDANGSLYSLQDDTLMSEDSPVPLAQFGELVRSHLVAMQQCCVYKVELGSYPEGFRLVRDTQEA